MHKVKLRKTGIFLLGGIGLIALFMASIIVSTVIFTEIQGRQQGSYYSFFGTFFLGLFFLWRGLHSLYWKFGRYIINGGHTIGKVIEFKPYTGSRLYPIMIKYSYEVDGKTYNNIKLQRVVEKGNREELLEEFPVFYDKNDPEKHIFETKKSYLNVFDNTNYAEKIRKDHEKKVSFILNGNFSLEEFYKHKGGSLKRGMFIFGVAISLFGLFGLIYLYMYQLQPDEKKPMIAAIIFWIFVTSISNLITYVMLKNFYRKNKEIYNILQTGKFAKGRLLDNGLGKFFVVTNGQDRTEIEYEFTDHNGVLHNKKTDTIDFQEILLLLNVGDEIDICYDPENPDQNFWILG